MPQKSKARGSQSKDREKKDERTQAERFIETARAIGVDERGKEFERALKKVLRKKKA